MKTFRQGAHYGEEIKENRGLCGKKSLQGKIREFSKNMLGKYQGIFILNHRNDDMIKMSIFFMKIILTLLWQTLQSIEPGQ